MDTENTLLQIAENEQNVGSCDLDTSANLLNNEQYIDKPITYFMSSPTDTNPDGTIKVSRMREIVESGAYDGAGQTLTDARLYSFYKPLENELRAKEDQYKKLEFDQSNFFYKTYKDLPRNWYSLKRNEYTYKLAKAEQAGDEFHASEYRMQIDDLDKKLQNYIVPEDDLANSTANLLASVGRNAKELVGVAAAAAVVGTFTGGAGALPIALSSQALQGLIIYNDTYKLEAGELLNELDPKMSLDERLAVAEDYGNLAALIEASGAFFGLTKLGTSAISKAGAKYLGGKLGKKAVASVAKKEILKEATKVGLKEKLKDPKFIAFLGKRVGEHVLSASEEGAQEVSQALIQDAFLRALKDGEDPNNIPVIENIFKIIEDGSETSKYGKLFLNTTLASLLISGTGAGVTSGTKTLVAKSAAKMNIDNVSQNIIDSKSKSVAYQKSPKAYSENTQKIVDVGNAPEKIAIDSSAWLQVLTDAEQQGKTGVLAKLNELGITKETLEESVKSTGQMEVDFAKFDDVVLDPKDEELFQLVKGKYTTDPTLLNPSELLQFSQNSDMVRDELAIAESDPNSVFNVVREALSKNENYTPEMVTQNAIVAQLMANRRSTFEGGEVNARQLALEIQNVKESMLDKVKKVASKVKEKIVNKKTVAKQNKPQSLLQFLIARGGIKDEHGELKVFDAVKQRPGLVNNKRGMSLDYARQLAEEAGYFGVAAKNELGTTTISDLLDKIDMELRGEKVYREEDISYISSKEDEGQKMRDIESYLEEKGFSDEELDKMSEQEKEDLYYKYLEIDRQERELSDEEIMELERPLSEEEKRLSENRELSEEDIPFFQKVKQHIAGVFSKEDGKYIIRMTEASNPTTFQHEFSHMITTDMVDSFNGGKMTPYWKDVMKKIADFVDAKIVNGKLNLTTEQHEKVANAWTSYLKEGRAPIEGLKDLFNRMREWFIDVYKRLRMGGVRLNKSIRQAFDALLVSQEELDKAYIDKRLRAIGRRSWISEHDYQQYLSDLSELSRVTTNQHIEAIEKEARIKVEQTNKEQLEKFKAEALAQLDTDPRYQLQSDVVVNKINSADIPTNVEFNNREKYTSPNGQPVQQFISNHDIVSNVADIADILNNLEDKEVVANEKANQMFDEWIKEHYPELSDTNMKIAAANKKMMQVRTREYMMLNNIPMSQFNQVFNELVEAGNKEVAKMSLRELSNIERLLELETKIVTKSRFAKTDKELSNALWHQAVINHIIMRAKEIRVELKRFNRHFDKYRYLPSKQELKKIDAYDFDMIAGILHNFGFTGKPPRMRELSISARIAQWIDNKMQSNFSTAEELSDFIPFLGREMETKFDKNTYQNFALLDAAVRQIEGISQSDYIIKEQGEEMLVEDIVNGEINNMTQKGINPSKRKWMLKNVTMIEEYLRNIFTKDTFLSRVLPFTNAFSKRTQRINNLVDVMNNALKETQQRRNDIVRVQLKDGNTLNMTYEDMQFAVIHIDNMEAWIASWNAQRNQSLNQDDFLSIIEQAPQEMIDNAQKIWDIFDSQKAEFRDAVYKTNGYLMKFVEPRKITLSDGREIQSGYFPARKMPTSQSDFEKIVLSFNNGDAYSNSVSPYAKDKNYIAHKDLDLGMNSLRSWIYHVATVIEVSPHYDNLSKIINNQNFRAFVGKDVVDILNGWMKYPIVGDEVNKVFSALDTASSIAILGFQPMKMIVQALGWVPVMKEVGLQWLAPQLVNRTLSPKQIMQKSDYMRTRYEDAIVYLGGLNENNLLIRDSKKVSQALSKYATVFTVIGDKFSSTAVWNAIYQKSLYEGHTDAEAVLLADSFVRTSQGDSSAISRAGVLRGNLRFFTKFASYFIAMNSKINSQLIGQRRIDAVATLMLATIASPILETMINSLVEWNMPTDDDKKKWKKLKFKTFEDLFYYKLKQNIMSTAGMIAMPAFGLGGYAGNLLATGQSFDNPLPAMEYAHSIIKATVFPVLALGADEEKDKARYWRNAKKSLLKSLTIPNKYVNMIVE